jgi:RNA polymerase sigma-70 factor (ECF subfamily)
MAKLPEGSARWLAAARAGSREALGQALEGCRHYLLRIANRRLDPHLKAKGGASDLVQQTFLEAQRDFTGFQGESQDELRAWLRQLLIHNLANFHRSYRATGKRAVGREVPLAPASPSTDAPGEVAAPTPTPSREAIEHEEAEKLRQALERLPEDYRRVITLHHQEQRTFEAIGRLMNRSTTGARTLWLRAVERLNQELGPADESG